MTIRLNIGCGGNIRPGYVNIDAFAPGPDFKMDAAHLAFCDRSCDEIFSSHVLEHLSKHEVLPILREWNRILKTTGMVEIIVPDLPWCMKQWLRLPDSARWEWALDTIFGLQDHPGEFHKTGFSTDRLRQLLVEAGFERIEVSTRFDHGMQSIRALAYGGGEQDDVTPHMLSKWTVKHLVFLFYRLATYLSPKT
jgi:predicted SAM-dependent methyltransferase